MFKRICVHSLSSLCNKQLLNFSPCGPCLPVHLRKLFYSNQAGNSHQSSKKLAQSQARNFKGYVMDGNITKSLNDTREYRSLTLDNGLKVLLISDLKVGQPVPLPSDQLDDAVGLQTAAAEDESEDEEEGDMEEEEEEGSEDELEEDGGGPEEGGGPAKKKKKEEAEEKLSAVSLCIGTGSFSDPADLPGLAHFLEHMVFMGSEKYPDENEFDAFVKRHGGNSNAFTDTERTVFYFDIQQRYFRAALDRFAGFFIKPLLKENSVDREIKAVDSEFDMSLISDKARKEQLLSSSAREGHPMGKFMWGNYQSLKTTPLEQGINIYERLQQFHSQMYSGHYMTLAVQSRDSLETIQQWALDIFSAVPNNSQPRPSFSHLTEPFNTAGFHKIYRVIPVKNLHQVEITWALPSLMDHYRSKPLHYLGWLAGHEGKGSILSYLKKKLWATSLSSGNSGGGFEENTTFALFSVTVTMTEEGMDNMFEVISVIFEYLEMLRRVGPQERVFKEIKTIEDNEFRWQEQGEPYEYVQKVSENMQMYPVEDYLTGDTLLFHYDPQIIVECQQQLLPSRANIVILSKRFEAEGICKEREKWFKTPYCVEDIPEKWKQAWEKLDPRQEFHIPEVNEYIATDFSLREPDVPESTYPVVINETPQSKLWYRKDNKFKVPKAHIRFILINPLLNLSPLNMCMLDLYIKVLEQNLSEIAYAADVAELSYSLTGNESGFIIKLNGLNHKLPKLFKTVVDYISKFEISPPELFDTLRAQLRKTYYNTCIKPTKMVKEVRFAVLEHHYWTSIDKQAFITSVTPEMLISFAGQVTGRVFVEGLVQGNFTAQEAKEMEKYLLDKLQCSPLPKNVHPERRVLELPHGTSSCRVRNFNPQDNNSAITNYYQHGPTNLHEYALNDLLLMHMEEPCFDILRTREQLGYSVFCMNRNTFGILGFSVTVCSQANKFSMQQLNDHMEKFLVEFGETIDKMTQKEFETLVGALISLKRTEDNHLGEEVDRNWSEITTENYLFERHLKEISELSSIKLDELKAWYHSHVPAGGRCKKLSIQIEGNPEGRPEGDHTPASQDTDTSGEFPSKLQLLSSGDSNPDGRNIMDIRVFKDDHKLYPESKLL